MKSNENNLNELPIDPKNLPKLNVFISSRRKDIFCGKTLDYAIAKIESNLKNYFKGDVLKFDMSKTEGAYSADKPAKKKCLEKVNKANIVLVIYNGHPGDSEICYDEFDAAIHSGGARTYLLDISSQNQIEKFKAKEEKRDPEYAGTTKFNIAFKELWNHTPKRQRSEEFDLRSKLITKAVELIIYGIFKLAHDCKSNASSGDHLDLIKLGYSERDKKLKEIFREELKKLKRKKENPRDPGDPRDPKISNVHNGQKDFLFSVECDIEKKEKRLVFSLYSIPAAFNVEQARGIDCRPYLNESNIIKNYENKLKKKVHSHLPIAIPIAIIICLRSITKAQIRKYYGSESLVLVETAFGTYMLDNDKNIQLFFFKNCNNQEAIKHRIKEFLSWLKHDDIWKVFQFDVYAKCRYNIVAKKMP